MVGGGGAARREGLSRRVLHVRGSRTLAGPERHLLELAPRLIGLGVPVEVVLLHRRAPGREAPHPLLAELAARRVPAWEVDDRDRRGSAARRALVRRIDQGGIAALHGHDPKADWVASHAARSRSLPWFATLHLHTRATWRARLYARLDRWHLRGAARVIAVARAVAEELPAAVARRAVTVPNGIDVAGLERRARRELPSAREALGPASEGPAVLAIGRLERQKGFDLLLRALAEARRRGKALRLVVAGEGRERASLQALAGRLGVAPAVRWLGERTDVAGLLAAADGVVLPSRREGLPYVLLEAMALGRPIVATAVGGVPEAIAHRREGWLLPAEDLDALVDGLTWLAAGGEEPITCGARARSRALAEFSADAMASRFAALYREVLT